MNKTRRSWSVFNTVHTRQKVSGSPVNGVGRKPGRLLVSLYGLALVSACDSSGPLVTSSPNMEEIVNVPELIRLAASTPANKQSNLLVNGNFESRLDGWGTCNNNNELTLTTTASEGQAALVVGNSNCAQQGLAITPGARLTLTCDARILENQDGWTGLGLSFYDESWSFISEPDAKLINGTTFQQYTVTATAPQNARNLGVWLYAENPASIDNCVLTADSQPQPPLTDNLLYNASFIDANNGIPENWNDRCNGSAYQNTSFDNKSLVLGDGACVHQTLSTGALNAIQGKDFTLSCRYTGAGNGLATISTNLTNKREQTGQNDEVNLQPTGVYYSSGGPVVMTNRLVGRAKDSLTPGDIFVAISHSGPADSLVVLDCSLTANKIEGPFKIGDTGPAGGVVFQVSDDGMSGLEAAPDEASSGGRWCDFDLADSGIDIPGVDNITDTSIADSNTGRQNTQNINAICTSASTAAQIASSYVFPNGQTDGFLPNNEELLQLYRNKLFLNSFALSDDYWSSTEAGNYNAWAIPFRIIYDAELNTLPKTAPGRVRPIRQFGNINPRHYQRSYELINSQSDVIVNGYLNTGYPEWEDSYISDGRELFKLEGNNRTDGLAAGNFRIKRHDNNLYLWVVTPGKLPAVSDSYPSNGLLWQDDSFEIYFNLGNESTTSYDANDYVKIFSYGSGDLQSDGFTIDPVTVPGINSRKQLSHNARCNTLSPYGELECELQFDLTEMGLANRVNAEFGFDIHWNIDEDGGNRESKWSWCSADTLTAWEDMSKVTCSFVLK